MQSVSVAVAKDRLPYLLHLVEQGETVQITRHGKPIAMITQIDGYMQEHEPTNFDIAYAAYRKRIADEEGFTDEDIDRCFNIPREIQIGLRHEEDFE